jgi:hypothetical protein
MRKDLQKSLSALFVYQLGEGGCAWCMCATMELVSSVYTNPREIEDVLSLLLFNSLWRKVTTSDKWLANTATRNRSFERENGTEKEYGRRPRFTDVER